MKPCRDCGKTENPQTTKAAIDSGRCDACQVDRDEYYTERMRQEHSPQREISYGHEESTYWNRDGKA